MGAATALFNGPSAQRAPQWRISQFEDGSKNRFSLRFSPLKVGKKPPFFSAPTAKCSTRLRISLLEDSTKTTFLPSFSHHRRKTR